MPSKETIGFYLKRIREENGVTLRKIQEDAGITSNQIRSIENSTANYTIDSLLKYCEALNVELWAKKKNQ